MAPTPELPNEESMARVNAALTTGLQMMMTRPDYLAKTVEKAKIMQTALTVDGKWTDPDLGVELRVEPDGSFVIVIPPDFAEKVSRAIREVP